MNWIKIIFFIWPFSLFLELMQEFNHHLLNLLENLIEKFKIHTHTHKKKSKHV